MSEDHERAERDAHLALDLARAADDRSLELDAEHVLAQVLAERDGSAPRRRCCGSRSSAARSGAGRRWRLRSGRVARRVSTTSRSSRWRSSTGPPTCARHTGSSRLPHGATTVARRSRFSRGDWDVALAVGLAAVDAGERHSFHRVVVRSWFVLLPLARSRGRHDLLARAYPRFAARKGREPDSPYARIITTAAHLNFAAIGLEPPRVPDVDERLASFEGPHGGPSWLAAVRTVVEAWVAADELDAAEAALARMAASTGSTTLAYATAATLRSTVLLARGDRTAASAEAERALVLLGDRAPWWRLHALDALASAGGGDMHRKEAGSSAGRSAFRPSAR